MSKPEEQTKPSFICAALKRLEDGCVARCDNSPHHIGKHRDSVIAVAWEMAVPSAAPVVTERRVLTAEDIERIGGGGHACRASDMPLKNTCGCYCGRHYDKNWEVILTEGQRHRNVICKCKPPPDAVQKPDLAQRIRDILAENKSPHDGNPTTYISWLQAKLLKIHKEVTQ